MGNNFEGPLRRRIKPEAAIILDSSAVIFAFAAMGDRGQPSVEQSLVVQAPTAQATATPGVRIIRRYGIQGGECKVQVIPGKEKYPITICELHKPTSIPTTTPIPLPIFRNVRWT